VGNYERWAPWLAALLALVLYVCTAAGHGYWLDSAEFTAAAVKLDISHPPGHPLFALWSKAFTWLPVGPLPFRVAVGQACAAAVALFFVQRALMRSIALEDSLANAALALGGTWLLGGAYGFWFQAVRAEVYALEAMLVCIAFERISAWARERSDPRPLYGACIALGLGLTNHHLIALLALSALVWPAFDARRRLGLALGFGASAAVCYAYLPLRALSEPPMDLGHPVTWRDFYWVISAQIYARYTGTAARQPVGERFADLIVLLCENFFVPVLLLALLGGYLLLRKRKTWPLAYLWWTAALVSLAGRAWHNEVRANPDVLGYMIPGFFALVALASHGAATLARLGPLTVQRGVALTWLALGVLSALTHYQRASLAQFTASDAFDDLRRRALPTRSVVILTTPDSAFRHWEGEAVEQLRGDITMLALPFLGYGGSDQVWLRRDPALRPLVESFARDGALSLAAVRELASSRPVFVELDSTTTLPLYADSTPDALLYRFGARGTARMDAQLYARIGAQRDEPETRKVLLWTHYIEALYFSAHGAFPRAREAVVRGLAVAPQSSQLVALRAALERDLPFDLRPFMVGQR
jgi:hypothetical protein